MMKIKRIRNIIESNSKLMLPIEYDEALIGLCYSHDDILPVYTYLALIEAHMNSHNETEEQSLNFIEDNVMHNRRFIIVDDTGV